MSSPVLETRGLTASYGDFQALFGIDLTLSPGETIAAIGANGAGKSTLMRSLSGVLRNAPDMIRIDGQPVGALPSPDILSLGLAMVPEGRRLFPSLSVEENLLVGAHRRKGTGRWNLDTIYRLFPVLKERRHNPGTALSGGQQQMVAIGRALMSNPRILLCDEISLGLAPVVIGDIYAAFPAIKEEGTAIVIVEQDITRALTAADRFYCLMEGRVTLSGWTSGARREDIQNAYFGTSHS